MITFEIAKKGAAKIGRSGTKLHPAVIGKWSDQTDIQPYLIIQCSCTGTANGHAAHKATFFENAIPNCRPSVQEIDMAKEGR